MGFSLVVGGAALLVVCTKLNMDVAVIAGCALLCLCVELTRRADAHIRSLRLYDSIACWQITIWTMALSSTCSLSQVLVTINPHHGLSPTALSTALCVVWAAMGWDQQEKSRRLRFPSLGWNVAHILLGFLGPQIAQRWPQHGLPVLQLANVAVILGFWGGMIGIAATAPSGALSLHPVDEHLRRCFRRRKSLPTAWEEVWREVFQHGIAQACFVVGTELLTTKQARTPTFWSWPVHGALFQIGLCWLCISFCGAAVHRFSGGGGGADATRRAGSNAGRWRFPYSADPAVRRQRYNSE